MLLFCILETLTPQSAYVSRIYYRTLHYFRALGTVHMAAVVPATQVRTSPMFL